MDTERTPEPAPGEPENEDSDFARGQHELGVEPPEQEQGPDFARGQHELDEETPGERDDRDR